MQVLGLEQNTDIFLLLDEYEYFMSLHLLPVYRLNQTLK